MNIESKQVLVACEESQAVCIAFRSFGIEAYSCDVLPCSGGHPEWHIMQDVLPLLNGRCTFHTMDGELHEVKGKWGMIIAHPPCTFLSNAGARHLWKGHELNVERYLQGLKAKEFFMAFLHADCDFICVENPVSSKIYQLPKYSQIVQPYQFGHPYTKRTCLWLRGLPLLIPSSVVEPVATYCPSGSYSKKHGDKHRGIFTKDRALNRSKTFPGIACAMAEQWRCFVCS